MIREPDGYVGGNVNRSVLENDGPFFSVVDTIRDAVAIEVATCSRMPLAIYCRAEMNRDVGFWMECSIRTVRLRVIRCGNRGQHQDDRKHANAYP
jgi:hypothetical protein